MNFKSLKSNALAKPSRRDPANLVGSGGWQSGYVSVPVLVFLGFLAALAFGAMLFVDAVRRPIVELDPMKKWVSDRATVVDAFKKAFDEDPTPESDSLKDPVMLLNGTEIAGFSVTVEDASSKFPVQWINPDIVSQNFWNGRLAGGKSVQAFKDLRETVGYGLDTVKLYGDIIPAEDLNNLFTPYAWANVNTSSEEPLFDLYKFRIPESGAAEAFLAKIKQKRSQLQLWKEDEMPTLLGAQSDLVYPIMNALPSMNVHFTPEPLLREVVGYQFPQGRIQNAFGIVASIVSNRTNVEISPQTLAQMIPTQFEMQKRVFAFLGTRTWFWRIRIKRDGNEESLVYATYNPDPADPRNRVLIAVSSTF